MAQGDLFHYNIATEGMNTCRSDAHKFVAVLGIWKVVQIIIDEDRAGGGPLGTTELTGGRPRKTDVGYKLTIKISTSRQWWEREYYIEKKKNINVFARFLNHQIYNAVRRAFVVFEKRKMINNTKKDIKVSAKFNDGDIEDKS